jgi:uncharacterized protein (DUF2062 family)
MNWFKAKAHDFYEQFISMQGSPAVIARSFAVGFWVAWFPLIGTHSLVSLASGFLLRAKLPAVYLGSWLCNPLTIPPMLWADYALGTWLVGGSRLGEAPFLDLTFRKMVALGWNMLLPMMLGGAILGLCTALIGYFPIKFAVLRVRRRQARIITDRGQD